MTRRRCVDFRVQSGKQARCLESRPLKVVKVVMRRSTPCTSKAKSTASLTAKLCVYAAQVYVQAILGSAQHLNYLCSFLLLCRVCSCLLGFESCSLVIERKMQHPILGHEISRMDGQHPVLKLDGLEHPWIFRHLNGSLKRPKFTAYWIMIRYLTNKNCYRFDQSYLKRVLVTGFESCQVRNTQILLL